MRHSSPALDMLLGNKIDVLDSGFVRPVDYMGNDASIVQAARVSYGDGTKTLRDDEGLIRYLLRNRHTTPFEMCEIKFHVRAPMDIWRQWIRHRTASVNEYSTRYSIAIDYAHATAPDSWRKQSETNHQGSSGEFLPVDDDDRTGLYLSNRETRFHQEARELYTERIEAGVAREQARKDLPLSTYTEAYWKIDLHNLMHFLELRLDSHAQVEIREYANAIASVVEQWVPVAWAAFRDYRFNAVTFTGLEVLAINTGDATHLGKREYAEFLSKLERFGIDTENVGFIVSE